MCGRQSFVDDLNLENTLEQELLGAVPEQKAIIEEIAEIEVRLKENPEGDEGERLVDRPAALNGCLRS